eukprot:m51a1_g2965 hypothetical protein (164) ;mRNA; r:690754-691495
MCDGFRVGGNEECEVVRTKDCAPSCSALQTPDACSASQMGCKWCQSAGACQSGELPCPECESLSAAGCSGGCRMCQSTGMCQSANKTCLACSSIAEQTCSQYSGCQWCYTTRGCVNRSTCRRCGGLWEFFCTVECSWCEESLRCTPSERLRLMPTMSSNNSQV